MTKEKIWRHGQIIWKSDNKSVFIRGKKLFTSKLGIEHLTFFNNVYVNKVFSAVSVCSVVKYFL